MSNDPKRECTGKTYTTFLSEILEATKAYEKRCGILDGGRDDARKQLFYASIPGFVIDARDKAATDKRTGYDSSCFISALQVAPCDLTGAAAATQGCAGKDAYGCLEPGRACQLPEECRGGFCKGLASGAPCGSGVCTAQGNIGAACPEGNIACDPAATFCKNGACQPLESEGVTCDSNRECAAGLLCVRTLVTDVSGKCTKPTTVAEGAPCNPLEGVGLDCSAGLACYKKDGVNYTCNPAAKAGEACITSEACDGAATCVRASGGDTMGVCKTPGGLMSQCSGDSALGTTCQITLSCYTTLMPALCQPRPNIGDRCSVPDLDCVTGKCDTAAAQPVCKPKASTGLACKNNNDCASGQCDAGTLKCKAPVCS